MYAKATLIDRREMLRVKIKSLAEEARIIRREEKRTHGVLRDELHNHRVLAVRRAARETHLAYGFIRGRTLEQMESHSLAAPNWDAVRRMIRTYGPKDFVYPECMKPEPVANVEVGSTLKPTLGERLKAVFA